MHNRAENVRMASFVLCTVIIFVTTLSLNIKTSNTYLKNSYIKTLQPKITKHDAIHYQETKFFSTQYAQEVNDTEPPQIISVTNVTTPPNYDKPMPIEANVTDDVHVDTVILNYSNSTAWFNLTMIKGEFYNATIPGLPWSTQVSYRVYANDTSGKWSVSDLYSYRVADYDPPVVSNIYHFPWYPEYNDTVDVYAKITKSENASPIRNDRIRLHYWNGSTHSVPFYFNPGIGFYVAEIPSLPWNTNVLYWVYAEDWAGNNVTEPKPGEDQKGYVVSDSYGPSILNLTHAPSSPEYNETVMISANVSEPQTASGIYQVVLSYFSGSKWQNVTMIGQDTYTAQIPTLSWNTLVQYKVYALDNAENLATSDTHSYRITDSYAPIIGSAYWNPKEPKTNTPVVVTASVSEPAKASGISLVTLSYNDGIAWANITMTLSNGVYTAQIPGFKNAADAKLRIYARDNAGNLATSPIQEYTVKASEPPLSLPLIVIITILIIAVPIAIMTMRKLKKRHSKYLREVD
jgi:hypothetical protein